MGLHRRERTVRTLLAFALVVLSMAGLAAGSPSSASAAHSITFATPGEGAGQVSDPTGVAVDQSSLEPSSGDVYIVEPNNRRVDQFNEKGEFRLAFGWGVRNGEKELQTCTVATTCRQGIYGTEPGEIESGENGVAVDGDPLSLSFHDVYVSEDQNHRVQEFTPGGEFVRMVGKEVNKTTEGNVCTATEVKGGDKCGAGLSGGGGEGELGAESLPVVVDAAGDVWVGDYERLEEFSSEGAFLSEVKLPGAGEVQSLAVESSLPGDFYIISSNVAGVQKRSESGVPVGGPYPLDASGHPKALGLAPTTGDLFVSDQLPGGPASLFEYGPTGTQLESFGTGGVLGQPRGNALAVGETAKALYVIATEFASVGQLFPFPEPGPELEEGGEVAAPVGKTTATLKTNINPEGAKTTYRFQYLTEAQFKQHGETFGAGTVSTAESGSIGEDFSEHPASAQLTGLSPETTYHFRVVAENECELEPVAHPGVISTCTSYGENATFATEPPLRIDATYATEVSSTSATLDAQINPLGEAASYRFEYLSEAAYQQNVGEGAEPFAGATLLPSEGEAQIASGDADVVVSQHSAGLAPATAYRYRVVAANVTVPAGIPGPVLAFTTQAAGSSTAALVLPDDRAWEMVSPAEKNGGEPSGIDRSLSFTVLQAAAGGESITWGSNVAFDDPAGSSPGNQYISVRGSGGWSTENIGVGLNSSNYNAVANPPYKFFSPDLTAGLLSNGTGLEELGDNAPPAPLPGTEAAPGGGNFYVRDNRTGGFQAVLTEANLQEPVHPSLPLNFAVATPDLRHIVFEEFEDLYEWSEGVWRLLNVLPGSTQPTHAIAVQIGGKSFADPREISTDGSRVVWKVASPSQDVALYLRENATREQSALNGDECVEPEMACTVQIDAPEPGCDAACGHGGEGSFLTASADDSKIFFTDQQKLTKTSTVGDLYVFEPEGEAGKPKLTDLTIDHNPGQNAEVAGVLGSSVDGSDLYFVAGGVLSGAQQNGEGAEAQAGKPNLYLSHEGAITFIATLAAADDQGRGELNLLPIDWETYHGVAERSVRVSADGHHVLFVSTRPLTGYDNDAANGANCGTSSGHESGIELLPLACPELFLYEAPSSAAPSGHLACTSCNPTGERPSGASGIPGATKFTLHEGLYDSRVLSANGRRVFFNSFDALVPQDTNGQEDVYEWEAAGEGTCEESSSTYSPASGGCVSLISSGTSSERSEFVDASENGNDVFFLTGQSLVPSDPGSVDLYDARTSGGFPEPPPPPSCEGDACQSPGSPPGAPTLGTSVTTGPGNLAPPASTPPPKPKPKPVKCKKPKKLSHGKCVKVKTKKQKAKKSNRRGK